MVAILTADIINSRAVNSEIWLPKLKSFLEEQQHKILNYQIYRGDSFQIETSIEEALYIALCIKALIKSNAAIDVRIAIGIGDKNYKGENLIESYGTAFINSGEAFELLKNDTLIIKTPFLDFDYYFNTLFKLLSFISNNWKPITSETLFYALTNQQLLQKELAHKLDKDTSTVNKALKRGGYEELLDVLKLYQEKVKLCQN